MATELKEAKIRVTIDTRLAGEAIKGLQDASKELKDEKREAERTKSRERTGRDESERDRASKEGGSFAAARERLKSEASAAMDAIPGFKAAIEIGQTLLAQRANLQTLLAFAQGLSGDIPGIGTVISGLESTVESLNSKIDEVEANVAALKAAPAEALQIEIARARLGVEADVGRAGTTLAVSQKVAAAQQQLDLKFKRARDRDAMKAFGEAMGKGMNK